MKSLARLISAAGRNLHPSLLGVWIKDISGIPRRSFGSSEHLASTMDWLREAHDACDQNGVSAGYSLIDGWLPPYPETTGYIIPTFFDYALRTGSNEWSDRAIRMANWEIEVQMSTGAVQAGVYRGTDIPQVPAVFNTGQVILGWCRAYKETGNSDYLDAASRAGNWLFAVQDKTNGYWKLNSSETETDVHAYDVRTAWSLLELFELTQEEKYKTVAKQQIDWTLSLQRPNGWFSNNSFFDSGKWGVTFTHTIAYVMEGLQEAHRILGDDRYYRSYAITAEKLMRIFELKKYMAGDFDENWKPSANYSCLTGDAQIAGVWLKTFLESHDIRYLNAALKLNDFVKSCQESNAGHAGIRGGVKGSQPLHGSYTPYTFPNWAAKFFADSLMLEEDIMANVEKAISQGKPAINFGY